MERISEIFPELTAQVSEALLAHGRVDLAEQLCDAVVARVTFDATVDAGYVHLKASRLPNIVEQNIIGVRHGETVALGGAFGVNVDTDNLGRISGLEILEPRALRTEFQRRAVV